MIPSNGARVKLLKDYNNGSHLFYKDMIGIVQSNELDRHGCLSIGFTRRKANDRFYEGNWGVSWNNYRLPLSLLLELDPDWKTELSL